MDFLGITFVCFVVFPIGIIYYNSIACYCREEVVRKSLIYKPYFDRWEGSRIFEKSLYF